MDGCDNFRTRYLINDTCVRLDKVYVYGAIREFDGQVSVFNYQGGPDYRTLFPDEEEMLAMPHPSKAVLGVTPGVVGCVETSETIKVILGSPYVLSGNSGTSTCEVWKVTSFRWYSFPSDPLKITVFSDAQLLR